MLKIIEEDNVNKNNISPVRLDITQQLYEKFSSKTPKLCFEAGLIKKIKNFNNYSYIIAKPIIIKLIINETN